MGEAKLTLFVSGKDYVIWARCDEVLVQSLWVLERVVVIYRSDIPREFCVRCSRVIGSLQVLSGVF